MVQVSSIAWRASKREVFSGRSHETRFWSLLPRSGMSFLRHREIYQSDVKLWKGEQPKRRSPIHRLDEFPAGYSLAGCSPALPASALPAETHSVANRVCRSRILQRTAKSVLTHCLTLGDKRKPSKIPDSRDPLRLLAASNVGRCTMYGITDYHPGPRRR